MKNGSTIGLIFTGLVVLAGGIAGGYYFIGGRNDTGDSSSAPTQSAAPQNPGTSGDATPPAMPAVVKHLASASGQFTAPGAPTIDITETKVSPPKPQAPPTPPPPPSDTEASQAGTDSDSGDTSGVVGSAATGASGTDSTSSSTPQPTPDSTSGSVATDSTSGGSAAGTSGSAGAPDTSNSQDNTSGSTISTGGSGSIIAAPPSSTLYHVVAGVVHSESNAKSLESALRHKGYTATILHQTTSAGDTYTVQIGAYSSQVTADEMVASLQHDGFPASVSAGQ